MLELFNSGSEWYTRFRHAPKTKLSKVFLVYFLHLSDSSYLSLWGIHVHMYNVLDFKKFLHTDTRADDKFVILAYFCKIYSNDLFGEQHLWGVYNMFLLWKLIYI